MCPPTELDFGGGQHSKFGAQGPEFLATALVTLLVTVLLVKVILLTSSCPTHVINETMIIESKFCKKKHFILKMCRISSNVNAVCRFFVNALVQIVSTSYLSSMSALFVCILELCSEQIQTDGDE